MPTHADNGPVCPGCGYSIFGLREMRCPECGRALDVRDFNLDGGQRSESRRYERHALIGGSGAVALLALILGLLLLVANASLRRGFVPCLLPLLIVAVAITLVRVLGQTGRSAAWLFKHRR